MVNLFSLVRERRGWVFPCIYECVCSCYHLLVSRWALEDDEEHTKDPYEHRLEEGCTSYVYYVGIGMHLHKAGKMTA